MSNDNHEERTINSLMDEKPEGWDQELYEKLSFEYLVECAENQRIDEWNALYREYLESEWKRLYPERKWDPENVFELVMRESDFERPDFSEKDFREAISRGVSFVEAHLEGADFMFARLKGADFWKAHLEGANFIIAHLKKADFREAHLEGVKFQNANLEDACFCEAHLEKADFEEAHLEEAYFGEAHLEGASFRWARLEGTYFNGAHLEEAEFWEAHLEGANFRDAHLEGADFTYAVVDGGTLFSENSMDGKTDFSGTALSATRIDPDLRTKLERNIRKIRWEEWYKKPKLYPFLGKISKMLWRLGCRIRHLIKYPPQIRYDPTDYPSLKNSTIYITLRKVLSWPTKPSPTKNTADKNSEKTKDEQNKWETKDSCVDRIINGFVRLFWCLTDYGSSTKRVILVFFVWNIFWAFIYQFILPLQPGPILAETNTTILNTSNIITAVMQTNLMMFSITDLATNNLDYPALICVTVHIVIGYFILAALITRLGIMFQNLSP